VSDGLADLGRLEGTGDMRTSFTHGRRWRVYIDDDRCFDKIEPTVRMMLARRHIDAYAEKHGEQPASEHSYVMRTMLPSKQMNDRAWNARFVWAQAMTSKRANTTRTKETQQSTECRFCEKKDADDLRHIVGCTNKLPRRIVRNYINSLQRGLADKHQELAEIVSRWVNARKTAMKQGQPGQPEGDDETDLARFLLGRWPADLCKLVEQLPEQEDEESGVRPAQALAWAGRHTHTKLWRPLWKLRKEGATAPDDDASSTTSEEADDNRQSGKEKKKEKKKKKEEENPMKPHTIAKRRSDGTDDASRTKRRRKQTTNVRRQREEEGEEENPMKTHTQKRRRKHANQQEQQQQQ
jgi:hypothetical protein